MVVTLQSYATDEVYFRTIASIIPAVHIAQSTAQKARSVSPPQRALTLLVTAFALIGGVLTLIVATQDSEQPQLVSQSLAEGEVSSPGGLSGGPDDKGGEGQERRVRELLTREGYEQPFGASDAEIRTALNIKGKVADFVGYRPAENRWLIAESKGGDVQTALDQLETTMNHLITKHPSAVGRIELRIYTNARQYAKLFEERRALGGWRLKDGHLGWKDGLTEEWIYAQVKGVRIQVQVAPNP